MCREHTTRKPKCLLFLGHAPARHCSFVDYFAIWADDHNVSSHRPSSRARPYRRYRRFSGVLEVDAMTLRRELALLTRSSWPLRLCGRVELVLLVLKLTRRIVLVGLAAEGRRLPPGG